jgi:hypothetical protein
MMEAVNTSECRSTFAKLHSAMYQNAIVFILILFKLVTEIIRKIYFKSPTTTLCLNTNNKHDQQGVFTQLQIK